MLVSQVQRVRNLPRNLQRFFERNRAARDPIGECLPVDEFQHQGLCAIRLVHAVDARDVRVIERGEDFGFLLETCEPIVIGQKSFREYFQGDIAFEFRVACSVDLSHSADADQRHDFIGSETRTGPETHGCAAILPVVSENCAGAGIDSDQRRGTSACSNTRDRALTVREDRKDFHVLDHTPNGVRL